MSQFPLLWQTVSWALIAYLIAAIPVGLIVGFLRGIDLRNTGSGNIGATNAVRALGRKWGLPVFALDVGKAALPVWFAGQDNALDRHPDQQAICLAIVAFTAFLGHVFPIYLRFRGGKGVASALGIFSVFSPTAGIVALFIYLQTLKLTGISAVGSLTGVSTMTLTILLIPELPVAPKIAVSIVASIIWYRHRDNLLELKKIRLAANHESKAMNRKTTEANGTHSTL